ncbi:MAG TPA: hypothetical protein VF731_06230 [Solirubrobacterales bacterium]
MTIATRTTSRGARALLAGVLALVCCLLAGVGSAAAAGPGAAGPQKWALSLSSMPSVVQPGEENDSLLAVATNVGGAPTSGTTTVEVVLPSQLTYVSAAMRNGFSETGTCTFSAPAVTCSTTASLAPGEEFVVQILVNVAGGASGTLVSQAKLTGGGAGEALTSASVPVGAAPAAPGIAPGTLFSTVSTTQAGAHPNAAVGFTLTTKRHREANGVELIEPAGSLRDIEVETPPGLIGSTKAAPKCSFAQFAGEGCPASSIVGIETVQMSVIGSYEPGGAPMFFSLPLYNLTPPAGVPAEFGFKVLTVSVILRASIRSGGDYGLTISGGPNSQAASIYGSETMFYGVPTRYNGSGTPALPFVSNPTACGSPLATGAASTFYQAPGAAPATALSAPTAWTGCDQLPFAPSLRLRPRNENADSPTGLDVDLHLPQSQDPENLTSAGLKAATVTLPEGLVVNPAGAGGLGACSEAEFEPHGAAPARCPDSAKIGTVEIDSPLLDHPLPGSVYVATPHRNPFGTLLAMYLAVEDPVTGITVKLPARVDPDPATGRLTVTVPENPQLPFEDVKLNLFGGPRSALKTPQGCGTYATAATLTPWSAPEGETAHVTDSFGVEHAASGGACSAAEPNSPSLEAGTAFTNAGADSPLVVELARPDGSQRLGAVDVALPPGLLGRLAGIPYCPDSQIAAAAHRSGTEEAASPSCPAASQVGTVTVAAGAGAQPFQVQGHAYLAGPYKGAPLSLAFVTPALAGPFDLGTVVVRAALQVDPVTTQVSVHSDPLPSILEGIPLDLRSLRVDVDRRHFTRNPTSCAQLAFGGQAVSLLGQAAPLAQRFQVGGCRGLGFAPRLSLRVFGQTRRTGHPRFQAVVRSRPGEADISRAAVTLPRSEFLENAHIRTVCTRVQYAANHCPKASIYGHAKAWSPLLERPLQGPVYLRSSDHGLPDLVASLDGQIHVDLAGRIDSVKRRMRTTFEAVPDAPISRFVLTMQGGSKGLLVNSTDLCRSRPRASAEFEGHNGKLSEARPPLRAGCRARG